MQSWQSMSSTSDMDDTLNVHLRVAIDVVNIHFKESGKLQETRY